jgi:catechol 2,3-dioxygenase-like lactoylglutathione lyase family enzyme
MLRKVNWTLLLLACAISSTGAQGKKPGAAFHHVHMNVVDPAASVEFYTKTFETTKPTIVAGWRGVQSDSVYLLFSRVPQRASTALDSALWHIGWGTPDISAFVQRGQASGLTFERTGPIVARVNALDGNPIEINSEYLHLSVHSRAFSHLHVFSAAPYCAADWYQKALGARLIDGADYRKVLGDRLAAGILPRGVDCRLPAASPSQSGITAHPNVLLKVGGVNMLIFPPQSADYLAAEWGGRRPVAGSLVSTRGHIVDHVAFSVADVDRELARLRALNVTVLENTHRFGTTRLKAAMIEGPDGMAIELVERGSEGAVHTCSRAPCEPPALIARSPSSSAAP